jgi:drug/metabolite transporter (DMT)-like permease
VSVLLAVGLNAAAIEPVKWTGGWTMLLLAAVFGLVDVALCWFLRTMAIQHIDPVTVATVSPCYAVITGVLSVCVGIDKLSTNLVIGGSIIFISAVVPELLDALSVRRK